VSRGAPVELSPTQRRLVAGLAVHHPQPVSSAWLLEAARNADADDPAARAALRSAVFRLRARLGDDAITTSGDAYALAADAEVDIRLFLDAADAGRKLLAAGQVVEAERRLRAARELWRGPILVDAPLAGDLPDGARAAASARATVTEHWAEAAIRSGQAAEAIGVLEDLVSADPLREHAWQWLIEAHLSAKHADAAARAARAALAALKDVGVTPSDRLSETVYEVLGGGAAKSAPRAPRVRPPSGLPAAERCVGRDVERDTILAVVSSVRDAGARLIVVSGEPGIGKSHLVTDVARRLSDDGMRVWIGHADPYDHVPYRPIVEVLRQLAVDADPVAVGRALSGPLRRLMGDDGPPAPERVDALDERHVLFEAIVDLIAAAVRRDPAVIMLEDVHWADLDSLLLVRHLLSTRPDLGVCVIVTLRDTSTPPAPVAHVLDDLSLVQTTAWISLRGLETRDLASLPVLADKAAAEARDPHELADAVGRVTGGNPLFAMHLLQHPKGLDVLTSLEIAGEFEADRAGHQAAADASDTTGGEEEPVPRHLAHVIDAFLAQLSEPTRAAMTMAAAQGVEFDAALLAATLDVEASSALDEAERAGVVRHRPDGTWEFRHQLVHAALEGGRSRAGRAERHLRVARAIERDRGHDAASPFSLARHYRIARSLTGEDPARRYATEAAERAEALLDFGLAARYYLEAAEVAAPAHATELRLRAATALMCVGDASGARRELAAAAEVALRARDADLLGRAAVAAAQLYQHLGEPLPPDVATLLERAFTATDHAPIRHELYLQRVLRAAPGAGIADLLVAGIEESEVLPELAERAFWAATPEGRDELAGLLARTPDDAAPAVRAITGVARWVHAVVSDAGSLDDPPDGVPAELSAEGSRDPRAAWSWWAWASARHAAAGRLAQARTATETMLAAARTGDADAAFRRVVTATYYGQLALIDAIKNPRVAAAVPHRELMDPLWTDTPIVWHQIGTHQIALAGDIERARRLLPACCDPVLDGQLPNGSIIFQFATLLQISVLVGDSSRVERLVEMLEPWSGRHALFRQQAYFGAVDLALGLAFLSAGRFAEAIDKLEASLDQHRRVGARPWEGSSLVLLARAHDRRGRANDDASARAASEEARRISTALGLPYASWILAGET
jgi:DNA-binding SARP family transcriptional activator